MIAFPEMLVEPAEQAGMKVPPHAGKHDLDNYDPEEYPHFHVYLTAQLGASMPSWSSHWDNAVMIAAIPADKIKTITYEQLLDMGLQVGYPQA